MDKKGYKEQAKEWAEKVIGQDPTIETAEDANQKFKNLTGTKIKKGPFLDKKEKDYSIPIVLRNGSTIYLRSVNWDKNDNATIFIINNSNASSNSSTPKSPDNLTETEVYPFQKIFYGAPGTGKSYKIKEKTKNKIIYRTTFHPDTDYATFVGCYKPSMDNNNNIVYSFTPQVFLIAYLRAWYEYLEYLQPNTSSSPSNVSKKEEEKNNTEVESERGEEEKGLVKKAEDVFLVIEEINRGNCAQIFGDIFQLLDRNKEGFSTYPIVPDKDVVAYIKEFLGSKNIQMLDVYNKQIKDLEEGNISTTNLPQLFQNADEIKLAFPPNFHIWATMNTSDQSLYPMDSAFKRRWEWKYIKIDTSEIEEKYRVLTIDNKKFKWPEVIEKINIMIKEKLHSADKQIGEFFVKPEELSFSSFRDKVLFYLFGDVFRDNKKFGDEFFNQKDSYLFEDLLALGEKDQEKIVADWLSRLGCETEGTNKGNGTEQSSSEEGDSNAGTEEESLNEEDGNNEDNNPDTSD